MPPSSIHTMHHPRSQIRAAARAEAAAALDPQGAPRPAAGGTDDPKQQQGEGLSFWDVLDVVNPLQHIPVVNRLYRAVTGDTIKPAAQIAGSTLLFGPVGFATAAADVALKQKTGRDAGDHLMAMLGVGKEGPQAATTQLAENVSASAPLAQSPPTPPPTDSAALAALRQEQVRRMTAVPGGSAAAMAAAGIPAAATATLPSPGSGGGDAVMAALADTRTGAPEQPQGMGLAQYRAAALPTGVTSTRPLVPPKPVQMAEAQRARASAPPPSPVPGSRPSTTPAPVGTLLQAQEMATAPTGAPVETTGWSQGGTPQLPSALIADLMMSNLSKYEDLAKQRQGR